MNYSEILCFGLILDSTVGCGDAVEWAEIAVNQFVAATGQSKEWIEAGLGRLEGFGYIRRRIRGKVGRERECEYRISEKFLGEVDVKVRKFRGRCPECKTVGDFYTEYVAVPHPFFRKLGACISHAAYVCLAVIIRHSLKWTGEKGVWSEWSELDRSDFQRLTCLEPDTITKAVKELDNAHLIERHAPPGKTVFYRALPENFGKLKARGPRIVEQPSKQEAKTASVKTAQNSNKTEKTIGIESAHAHYGFCQKCRHFVTPEEVSDEELAAQEVERPPRAVPKQEKKPKSKFWDDMERQRDEAIERALKGIA